MVCLSLADIISPNMNLSNEVLKSVAQQMLLKSDGGNTSIASYSDATTVDSDDPTSSDCGAIGKQLILPPTAVKTLQQNKLTELKPKRRGGWPKGRKRKPEVLHLPPKAPATGYNLYLNDMRKPFKNSGLACHEITKIVGNQWSNLSLEQKQPFLLRAEEDKRRYKNELREYRQSGSYQLYMAKKRKKRVQNYVVSESDMDATDDIDDEDNEELYCRTCDQWFHNLHNKREHLQSRIHLHAVVGDMRSELECKAPAAKTPIIILEDSGPKSVCEIMVDLISAVSNREKDAKNLNMLVQEGQAAKMALSKQLTSLKDREVQLRNELLSTQNFEKDLESKIFDLWRVPSLFITTDLNYSDIEASEYSVTE